MKTSFKTQLSFFAFICTFTASAQSYPIKWDTVPGCTYTLHASTNGFDSATAMKKDVGTNTSVTVADFPVGIWHFGISAFDGADRSEIGIGPIIEWKRKQLRVVVP